MARYGYGSAARNGTTLQRLDLQPGLTGRDVTTSSGVIRGLSNAAASFVNARARRDMAAQMARQDAADAEERSLRVAQLRQKLNPETHAFTVPEGHPGAGTVLNLTPSEFSTAGERYTPKPVADHSKDAITPYQQKILDLRNREAGQADQRIKLQKERGANRTSIVSAMTKLDQEDQQAHDDALGAGHQTATRLWGNLYHADPLTRQGAADSLGIPRAWVTSKPLEDKNAFFAEQAAKNFPAQYASQQAAAVRAKNAPLRQQLYGKLLQDTGVEDDRGIGDAMQSIFKGLDDLAGSNSAPDNPPQPQ